MAPSFGVTPNESVLPAATRLLTDESNATVARGAIVEACLPLNAPTRPVPQKTTWWTWSFTLSLALYALLPLPEVLASSHVEPSAAARTCPSTL